MNLSTQRALADIRDNIPDDGLYHDVPFADYLAWKLPSQSSLKAGRVTMAHLKAALDGERTQKVTDDMTLGSALGVAFLEPAQMVGRVILWDPKNGSRKGAKWEAFKAEHANKAILTESMYKKLDGMVKSLRRNPAVRKWVSTIEAVEVSAVGKLEGVKVKGRADALPVSGPIVDIKKVTSCDDRTIAAVVERLGYFIQGGLYRKLFKRTGFELLCVEGTYPHDVRRVTFSEKYLNDGYDTVTGILNGMKHCQQTGVWPGYGDEPLELDVPAYRDNGADEITIGGEKAYGSAE